MATVRFKIVNGMGAAVRVRLVHYAASFGMDIAKDQEYVPKPGEALLPGERAVIVFDKAAGAILAQSYEDITADVQITLAPGGVSYGPYQPR